MVGEIDGEDIYTHLGHELHRHLPVRVSVLQVMDELCEVLDGVDVVVRGGRDQTHPGSSVSVLSDVLCHLLQVIERAERESRWRKVR